jgi:hypothetical protein
MTADFTVLRRSVSYTGQITTVMTRWRWNMTYLQPLASLRRSRRSEEHAIDKGRRCVFASLMVMQQQSIAGKS